MQLRKEVFLQFVDDEFSVLLERKRSKFISYLLPYQKFEAAKTKLKQEHPKARHFVYAYRYLNEHEQIVENSGDDGEPRGTSGKPSLAVLSGLDAINTGVIIVRYLAALN
jgi:putative IMPACT (imprinted ancient) family translation regulator